MDETIKELRTWSEMHIKVGNRQARLMLKLLDCYGELVAACRAFQVYDSGANDNDRDDIAIMLDYADAREKIDNVLAKITAEKEADYDV